MSWVPWRDERRGSRRGIGKGRGKGEGERKGQTEQPIGSITGERMGRAARQETGHPVKSRFYINKKCIFLKSKSMPQIFYGAHLHCR